MNNLPDEFFEWLNNCPVLWLRTEYDESSATYTFITPENETNEDENE